MRLPFSAIALSCLLLATPLVAGSAHADDNAEAIESAIAVLDFNRNDAQWTKSGKPRVDAIEALLAVDISAADRDTAWDAYRAPAPDPQVDAEQVETLRDVIAAQSTEMAALNARIALLSEQREGWQSRALGAEQSLQLTIATRDQDIADALAEGQALEARYEGLLTEAEADRNAATRSLESANALAQQKLAEAHHTLQEAKARERGEGPAATQSCREALAVVLDADWTWAGNLKTDEAAVDAADKACLTWR